MMSTTKIDKLKEMYELISSNYGELWSEFDNIYIVNDLLGFYAKLKGYAMVDFCCENYDKLWDKELELSSKEIEWLTCSDMLDESLYGALLRLKHLIGLLELDAMISQQEINSLYDWHEYMFTEDVKGFACNHESYEASFED